MNFVKAADFKQGMRWVDLDKVESVAVELQESGGGVDILSVLGDGPAKSSPKKKTVIISLGMGGGEEEIRYSDFDQADQFLTKHFNIKVPFGQM